MNGRREHTLAIALVAALACANPVAGPPRTIVSTMRPLPVPRTDVRVAPRLEPMYWAALDGPREHLGVDAVLGTLRVTLRGNETSVADEFAPEPIIAAVHDGDRWVFADASGRVFASHTFTGALQPLGRVPGRVRVNPWHRDRLILVDEHGTAWSTDGTRDIARVDAVPAPVRDAAFISRQRGVAILVGGGAMRTDDGGRSWRRVESVSEIVDAHVTYGRYELRRSDGRVIESSTGREIPELYDEYAGRDLSRRDGLLSRVAAAAIARHPRLLPSLSQSIAAVPLRAGRVAAMIDEQLVAIDVASGRVVHTYRELPRDCDGPERWGNGVAVICGPDDYAVWRIDGATDEATPVRIEERASDPEYPYGGGRDLTFSDDGSSAVFLGACVHDATNDAIAQAAEYEQEFACVLDSPSRSWRTLRLSSPLTSIDRLDAGAIRGTLRSDPVVLDSLVGGARTLTFAHSTRRHPEPSGGFAYALDGTAYAIDRAEFPRWLFVSPDGADPAVHRVPPGVTTLALRDRRHGVAVGTDLGSMWTTDDGGTRWTRIDVPHDEVIEHVGRQPWPEPRSPEIRCEADACVIGDQVEIRGEGPLRIENIDSGHRFTVTRFVHDGIPTGPPLGPYRCDAPEERVAAGTHQASDAHVSAHVEARGDTESVSVEWSGIDIAGPYGVRSPEAFVARSPSRNDTTRYAVLGTTRESALVARCEEARFGSSCQIAVVTARVGFVALRPAAIGLAGSTALTVESAAVLDDGSYAMHVSTHSTGWGETIHSTFVVRGDRSVVATRRLHFTQENQIGPDVVLGVWHQQAGLVWRQPRGPRGSWFFPATREGYAPPIAVPHGDGSDAATCVARTGLTPQHSPARWHTRRPARRTWTGSPRNSSPCPPGMHPLPQRMTAPSRSDINA